MNEATKRRQELCVSQTYWKCPTEGRGLLDVAVETYRDFYDLLVSWYDKRKGRTGSFPLTIELDWDDEKGIGIGIIDHRHESEANKPTWRWFGNNSSRTGLHTSLTFTIGQVRTYNAQYRSTPRINVNTYEVAPIGEFGSWRYTVSPCLFKLNADETEYFSLLRCYDDKWKKGDDAVTIELIFDEKDGPVNIQKTANSVLNAGRFAGWADDNAWAMATWLSKQKKIIKRAQKKPINATGLGEFETLKIYGFYRPAKLVPKEQQRVAKYTKCGNVVTKTGNWTMVETSTVSNPNGDIGILFACGNNLFLFVEHDQTYVLSRTMNGEYYKHGLHNSADAWSLVDPEDEWAEIRIAKAINVFFESKSK